MTHPNIDKRIVIGPWPNTRKLAMALGTVDYYTGTECINGHLTIRRAASGKCFECDRNTWERVRRKRGELPFKPNVAKQAAEKLGERYFDGDPCPHGHSGLRWTHNGACVECTVSASREFQKTQEGRDFQRKWRAENLDKVREFGRNTKARRKGAEGRHTAQDVRDILKRQKYKCAECGVSVKKKRHIDHVMPLALGGTNWPHNLQILCPACNLTKNAKHPIDFAQSRGRLL